jgi:hypothetical protein
MMPVSKRLFLLIFTLLLSSCATFQEKPLQTLETLPTITANHVDFKTFVIRQPIEVVTAVMVQTAKEEGFDEIIVFDDTITVKGRRVIIDENGLINYAGKTAGVATVGMAAWIGLLGFGFGGGSLAVLPSIAAHIAPAVLLGGGLYGASDNKTMTSVNGVAKLSSIDSGTATEIKLNFVKLLYDKKFSLNPFASDEFFVNGVEIVDDPKIYSFAFKRFQGIKADFPDKQ